MLASFHGHERPHTPADQDARNERHENQGCYCDEIHCVDRLEHKGFEQ
jgi:hypothetical protein